MAAGVYARALRVEIVIPKRPGHEQGVVVDVALALVRVLNAAERRCAVIKVMAVVPDDGVYNRGTVIFRAADSTAEAPRNVACNRVVAERGTDIPTP
jgi:hypothetical protein